jgi:hypothetical protein
VKSLLRKLKSYKASLRREKLWKRKERRDKLHLLKATGFALKPQDRGEGPQTHKDVVRELFRQHSKEFLRHVRRHILQDGYPCDTPRVVFVAKILIRVGLLRVLSPPISFFLL